MRNIVILLLLFVLSMSALAASFQVTEQAYRHNNLGVALMEQYKHGEAIGEFRQALAIKPDLALARINLALAYFNSQELEEARIEAESVSKQFPGSLTVQYLQGLIARSDSRIEDAKAAFRRVLEKDPTDVGANVNLGQIFAQERLYDEARVRFQTAFDAEPYNTTAIYNLALTLQRAGDRDRAKDLLTSFQALRENGAGTSIGQNYLEQGRYAEALASTGAEGELVDPKSPKVSFKPDKKGFAAGSGSALSGFLGKKVGRDLVGLHQFYGNRAVLIDSDGDGVNELFVTDSGGQALLRRESGGKYQPLDAGDLTRVEKGERTGAVAGDFDNDGREDLFVLQEGQPKLYRNEGKDVFRDVSVEAKIPAYPFFSISCAFVDVDHDGDLDIFIAGLADLRKIAANDEAVFPIDFPKAPNLLLRNNGNGTFEDVSEAAKVIGSKGYAVAVIPTDFDNRRDIDLLIVNYGDRPTLFRNLRNSTFEDAAVESGLNCEGTWTSAAAGDFNKDGYVDFFFGRVGDVGVLAESDGRGGFLLKNAPAETRNASANQFLDYDNDGLLDLVVINDSGLVIVRNLGSAWKFERTASYLKRSKKYSVANSPFIVSADFDRDGDVDLLTRGIRANLQTFTNQGGDKNNSEALDLKGLASSRSAFGAKVEMRAGSLSQKLESYSASPMPAPSEIRFGLGRRVKPDAVRVIWTSGIVQAETEFASQASTHTPKIFEELDRKPSSCPYLYTWNGRKFEFITDFLGGGEMGNWAGPGVYHHPDSTEYVRIPPGKLQPKDGRYELRVTNELEEVMYMDKAELIAIEHDSDTDVFPNEGLGIPTFGSEILYTTRNVSTPLAVSDGFGTDILPKVKDLDLKFYDTFKHKKTRGYAEDHELTINLDDKAGFKGRTLLLMTGWTDYAFSSDNLAASQSGQSLYLPKLQVRNRQGDWTTVIDSIGISIGRPQTLVVDLTGKFLTDSREVRILTNFKTYWDKIEVDTSPDDSGSLKVTKIKPARADLSERGFSEEVRLDDNPMIGANYDKVFLFAKWKYFAGTFTRTGDVRELLDEADDNFVISKTGDEFVLSFTALPALPAGREYTFLLYADGYSKEMDINSGSPDVVFPLPFKNMSKYPYDTAVENYPMTDQRLKLFDKYNTRKVFSQLPALVGENY